jgi:hypothetical protein
MNASRFQDMRRGINREFRDNPGKAAKAFAHLVRRSGATTIIINHRIIGWRMKTGEIVCAKKRFANEEQAVGKIEIIADNDPAGHVPIRAYACAECRGWHLTSQMHLRDVA